MSHLVGHLFYASSNEIVLLMIWAGDYINDQNIPLLCSLFNSARSVLMDLPILYQYLQEESECSNLSFITVLLKFAMYGYALMGLCQCQS